MADHCGTARSNYFRVKDKQKFVDWCESLELKPIYQTDRETESELCGFLAETEYGLLPVYRDEEDIDFFAELSTHLADGAVGIVMEVGNEKMRYITGFAGAVNSKGEVVCVSIDDIYEKAEKLGNVITMCED